MKRYLIFALLAVFAFGFVATSCKSKNQCKQFHRKQKRRGELFEKKEARYEEFAEVKTSL